MHNPVKSACDGAVVSTAVVACRPPTHAKLGHKIRGGYIRANGGHNVVGIVSIALAGGDLAIGQNAKAVGDCGLPLGVMPVYRYEVPVNALIR